MNIGPKKYNVLTKTDLKYFNVWNTYEESGTNFLVEVDDENMVYYPLFRTTQESPNIVFDGWI